MIGPDNVWIPDLNPKGYGIFNDYHRFLLLYGPRQSTKTINAVNKICRHLWENDCAKVLIVGKSVRNIKSSGVWQDLTVSKHGIPAWIASGIGFDYTAQPKITADTKMTHFRIRNAWGTESECQVHSLEHDFEVEIKFKGTRYTMVYLPEADAFKDRLVFMILADQLRSDTVDDEHFQILLDCNPPEEGEDHFLYDLFFRKVHPDGKSFEPDYADLFHAVHFSLEDNLWMSSKAKERLKEQYRYDPALYSRYAIGSTWQKFSTTGHFHDFFFPNIHVKGSLEGPESEREYLVPSANCTRLIAGWDLGDVNHSWTLYAPEVLEESTSYSLIDECVYIDTKMSIEDFVEEIITKMNFWEEVMRSLWNTKAVQWTNWSDTSAFKFRAVSRGDEALLVRQCSAGRILLRGVQKGTGSPRKRIQLMKKLFFANRIAVSAKCVHHIDMFRRLRPPPTGTAVLVHDDPLKHVFDSSTYALQEELPRDLERRFEPPVARATFISLGHPVR